MKYVFWVIALLLLGSIVAGFGAVLEPAMEPTRENPVLSVAEFQGDHDAAVSFTFDDGLQCHADLAAPMLSSYGFHGTFYVIAGKAREHQADPFVHDPRLRFDEGKLSWEEIRHMAALGHEIGNHSWSHPFLPRITPEALHHEVQDAADRIAAEVGKRPLTFACPYNEMNAAVRAEVLREHVAIREPWADWGGKDFTAEKSQQLFEAAATNHQWLIPMIHGIDGGFLPLSSQVFRANLAYLQGHADRFWVDTYANVARYRQERLAAQLEVASIEPARVSFTLRAALDPALYDVHLTVKLKADDETITNLTATRDGQVLPTRLVGSTILIDAVPGPEPITVRWE